jgi:hypothetical protein
MAPEQHELEILEPYCLDRRVHSTVRHPHGEGIDEG